MTSDRDYLAGEIRRRAARLFANSDREHETCSYEAADILLYRGISTVPSFPSDHLDEVDRVIWECTSFPGDEEELDDDDLIDVTVGEDENGLFIATSAGTLPLDLQQALAGADLLTGAVTRALLRPVSADDPSSILSRGTRPVLREA
ncbi:hypothetical protein [Corynebacterium sp.]|uniref:hypothetical protein n=1 Tax=Corynebacterium sp. TaxID=1720 RepID=UPI0025C64AD8|nr:hypothetical protein [Corynebacterium sp.]